MYHHTYNELKQKHSVVLYVIQLQFVTGFGKTVSNQALGFQDIATNLEY